MPSLAVRGAYRSPRYDLRVCRNPPRTRSVAGPTGDGIPVTRARSRSAATTSEAVAGERPCSKSSPR